MSLWTNLEWKGHLQYVSSALSICRLDTDISSHCMSCYTECRALSAALQIVQREREKRSETPPLRDLILDKIMVSSCHGSNPGCTVLFDNEISCSKDRLLSILSVHHYWNLSESTSQVYVEYVYVGRDIASWPKCSFSVSLCQNNYPSFCASGLFLLMSWPTVNQSRNCGLIILQTSKMK